MRRSTVSMPVEHSLQHVPSRLTRQCHRVQSGQACEAAWHVLHVMSDTGIRLFDEPLVSATDVGRGT
jgi:hypothetical protein